MMWRLPDGKRNAGARGSARGRLAHYVPVVERIAAFGAEFRQLCAELPAGLGEPHSAQNLPLLTAPHEHAQHALSIGFDFPQLAQNLPEFDAPQLHVQRFRGCGCGAPQLWQNLPELCSCPQEHTQPWSDASSSIWAEEGRDAGDEAVCPIW